MKSIVGEYGSAIITALIAGSLMVLIFTALVFQGNTGVAEMAQTFGEKILAYSNSHVEEKNTQAIRQVYQRGVADVKFKGEERILCNRKVNLRNYFVVTNIDKEEVSYQIEDIFDAQKESLLYRKTETGEKIPIGNVEEMVFTKMGVYQVILETADGKGIKRKVQVEIPVGR